VGSREISAAAERAREQLREEFEQLRVEIEELDAEESSGDGRPFGAGFRGRARASLAVLALTTAVAAAAANFALNGGRTPKDGGASVPQTSSEPEPGVVAAERGSTETAFPALSLIAPGLQTDALGSLIGLPSAGPPFTGPSPVFVVGGPVPVSVHRSQGEEVAGANPVGHSPPATPPVSEPHAPQELTSLPPPAPGGGPGGGGNPGNGEVRDNGLGGGGKGPGDGGKPGNGYGHIKTNGKGHGGSPGKGHEKDQSGGEVAEGGYGDNGSPGKDPGGHGHGHGGSHGGGPPPATAAPADPGPPAGGPGSDSNGNPGKGESHGKGQG
jgi:hypothetical protein